MRKISTDKKVYYSVCITLAFMLAVIMIYREIPRGSDEKTVHDRLVPEAVTLCTDEAVTVTGTVTEIKQTNSGTVSENMTITDNGTINQVNINTADLKTLMSLKGIGEKKAQNIIDYRTANGNFASIDELANVSGIGAKTVESLRPFIKV